MKDKIVQLMKSESLSPSRLAEILEIQPSGVSHLVSGRNKPSFELLQKILLRFPRINPDWLILDSEEIYRVEESQEVSVQPQPLSNTPDVSTSQEQHPLLRPTVDLFTETPTSHSPIANQDTSSGSIIEQRRLPKIVRVVLLYDDGSCESYTMK